MAPWLGASFGNANSLHSWGREAHEAVEKARGQVARLLGAEDPVQIVFTSGATEANNWVMRSFKRVALSPFEHSSLHEAALARLNRGEETIFLHNHGLAMAPAEEEFDLVSVMAVNNEVGATWVAPELRGRGLALHSDLTQLAGKGAIDLDGLDYASLSAHKFYGLKGVGALYCRETPPEPLLYGGEQERGFRGGTLNVPAIVGMGEAARLALESLEERRAHVVRCREAFLDAVSPANPELHGGLGASPYILGLSFPGVQGETLVIELDAAGFAISGGAACSSRSTEPSHVLVALGLSEESMRSFVRVSFGPANTIDSSAELGKRTESLVRNLRS